MISLLLTLLMLGQSEALALPPQSNTVTIASGQPELCDGQVYVKYWEPQTAVTIQRIEMVPLSDGAFPGQPFPAVDYMTTVFSSRPAGRVLALQAIDHYTPFSADMTREKVFLEDERPILFVGDHISIIHSCQALWGMTSHSQYMVVVTYKEWTRGRP